MRGAVASRMAGDHVGLPLRQHLINLTAGPNNPKMFLGTFVARPARIPARILIHLLDAQNVLIYSRNTAQNVLI